MPMCTYVFLSMYECADLLKYPQACMKWDSNSSKPDQSPATDQNLVAASEYRL